MSIQLTSRLYLVMCALMKMATHRVAHEPPDELSSEHSNGPPAKHNAEIMSQKAHRKRARRMSDSESDGDTGVHFVHDDDDDVSSGSSVSLRRSYVLEFT